MKKLILTIISSIMVACMLLTGCGGRMDLSFSNNFVGGGGSSVNPNIGYTETLTYAVNFNKAYDSNLSMNKEFNGVLDYNAQGEYTTTLKVITYGELPESAKTTDIVSSNSGYEIYRLTSKLTLSINVNGQSFNDTIDTDVYFLSNTHSFAPIYSTTSMLNTYVAANFESNTLKIEKSQSAYQYQTIYSLAKYTITKTQLEVVDGVVTSTEIAKQVNEYNYKSKTVIDNNQLLFALRNFKTEDNSTSYLPAVAPAYGNSTDLAITTKSQTTRPITLLMNGVSKDYEVPIKTLSFSVASNTNSGLPQYLSIQKVDVENLSYLALPLEYVEPIASLGNHMIIGTLVYQLTSVDIHN